jgi:hypothetical protein
MYSRFTRLTAATVLFLAFATGVMYLPVSFAAPASDASFLPQSGAILTTGNNQPIMVNGVNAITGATVMSGAAIETPDQVGASLSIPGHFTLDIAAKASLSVEFTADGIKINLIKGCVVLRTTKGTSGEIVTSQGVVGRADGTKDARLEVCDPSVKSAPAAAASTGIGTGAVIAIIAALAGGIAIIPILTGGDNSSPGIP